MRKYDELWSNINKLLSHLRAFNAVELVAAYYSKYGNEAPPELLRGEIQKLERFLENAPEQKRRNR